MAGEAEGPGSGQPGPARGERVERSNPRPAMGLDEVLELFGWFHGLLTGSPCDPADPEALGKLKVFSGVKEFPIRVKCATLPWHTLRAAIEGGEAVTTE